jgi:hypothetical protein
MVVKAAIMKWATWAVFVSIAIGVGRYLNWRQRKRPSVESQPPLAVFVPKPLPDIPSQSR